VNAAAQRHAAFEVEQKLDRARLDFFRQVGARFDHLNHALGARRFIEKLVDLVERGFQISSRILRVRIGIAADRIDRHVDAVPDQTWCYRVAYRRFFPDRGAIELFVDVAMPLDHHAGHQQFFCIHSALLPFLKERKYCATNTG
jgi:hypothetical protein